MLTIISNCTTKRVSVNLDWIWSSALLEWHLLHKWLTISSGCPIEISTAGNDVIFSKWKLNVHLNWISVCTPSSVIHTIITFWSFALRFPTRYYAYGGALNYWSEIQVFVEKIKTYFLWCYIYIQELDLSLSFPFLHCRFCLLLILNCLSIRMRAIPTIKANVDYLNLLPEILFPNTNWSSGFQLKLNHTPNPPKKNSQNGWLSMSIYKYFSRYGLCICGSSMPYSMTYVAVTVSELATGAERWQVLHRLS